MKVRPAILVLFTLLATLTAWLISRMGPAPDPLEVADQNAVTGPELEDFLPFAPADEAPPDAPVYDTFGSAPGEGAILGEHTLKFRDAAAMQAFLDAARAAGLDVRGVIPELLSVRVAASAAALRSYLGEGAAIDSNYRITVPTEPDPDFWQSANLRAFRGDAMRFLGAPALERRLEWGKGVVIAVLDTGWLGHAAVASGVVREIDVLGGSRGGEIGGHGTAVAGLIASSDPNAPGIAPGASILAVRVLDGDGKGDAFTLAQGILAAVNAGADVINMSLGGYGDSQVLRDAVAYAAGRGVVMVAATGNDGRGTVTYPAAYPQVIGVAAIDAAGDRAPFSNYGDGVALAAPGYQLNALWADDAIVAFDGTSASAPLVAGMAARILQQNLATTPDDVGRLIIDQANETGLPGDDPLYGAGILSVERIEAVGQPGIYDIALADLYPALERADGATFPLLVSLENRGTEFLPGATVELTVNGTPYFYRFSGLPAGAVESVQIPVPEALLQSGQPFTVTARTRLPDAYTDSRPANNAGQITLSKPPGG